MSINDKEKWNAIYQSGTHDQKQAAQVLTEHPHLLPESGNALDLACGLGTNAIFLARHKLDTSAWDISKEAISTLDKFAKEAKINLATEVRDVSSNPPPENTFDVIVVSHFLDRKIIPDIKNALKKNGLVFYQTFISEKINETGPKNPDDLLDKNELLGLFENLHILVYREEGTVGDTSKGFRNEAMLIAQKI